MAKRLVLGRDDLLSWLLRPDLAASIPEFAEVAAAGQAAWAAYRPTLAHSCCVGNLQLLFPVLDRFLAELRAASPELRERLRADLMARKGCEPRPILILYRKTSRGGVDRLEF